MRRPSLLVQYVAVGVVRGMLFQCTLPVEGATTSLKR